MLMDEPIGALDAKLREEMRAELRRLHVENGSTTVYVTHDQVEAMSMADKIGVMNDGVLQQYDSPTKVYDAPTNLFVAQFVGSPIMNVVDCQCRTGAAGTEVRLAGMVQPFVLPAAATASLAGHGGQNGEERLALGIRPEAVSVALTASPDHVEGRVHLIEPLGAYDIVDIAVGDATLRARTSSQFVRAQGDAVWIKLDDARIHFFDKRSGLRLQAGS
jgi:multiple sugar transport system ATP-binding protein